MLSIFGLWKQGERECERHLRSFAPGLGSKLVQIVNLLLCFCYTTFSLWD